MSALPQPKQPHPGGHLEHPGNKGPSTRYCRRQNAFASLTFLGLALACAPALFAESTNTLTLRTDLPGLGASAVRALGALALVLAVFFGGVWLFRHGRRIAWRKTGAPRLAVLESRPLGNRFALHVVGYDQSRLLIGSSPAGLILLSPLPAEPEPKTQPAVAQPLSFAHQLQQLLKRGPAARAGSQG